MNEWLAVDSCSSVHTFSLALGVLATLCVCVVKSVNGRRRVSAP